MQQQCSMPSSPHGQVQGVKTGKWERCQCLWLCGFVGAVPWYFLGLWVTLTFGEKNAENSAWFWELWKNWRGDCPWAGGMGKNGKAEGAKGCRVFWGIERSEQAKLVAEWYHGQSHRSELDCASQAKWPLFHVSCHFLVNIHFVSFLSVTFAQPTLKWQYYLFIYCPDWCSLCHCFYLLTPIKEC